MLEVMLCGSDRDGQDRNVSQGAPVAWRRVMIELEMALIIIAGSVTLGRLYDDSNIRVIRRPLVLSTSHHLMRRRSYTMAHVLRTLKSYTH